MSFNKSVGWADLSINPIKETISVACCDCGLVHRMAFAIIKDNEIAITFRNNKRATAQLRRHNYGYLQQGKDQMYKMVKRGNEVESDIEL